MKLSKNSLRLLVTTIVSLLWLYLVTQYEVVATIFTVLLIGALVIAGLMSLYSIFQYFDNKKSNPAKNLNYHKPKRNYPLYNAIALTALGVTGLMIAIFSAITFPIFILSATLTLVLPIFLIVDKSS